MNQRPLIFISAVSRELRDVRQSAANTLQFMGYEPVWQDIFGTEQGDLRAMLRRKIDQCSGVVQLIGRRYGAEPPTPDPKFGRVSYTQYEALYAQARGKKVWYLVMADDFPASAGDPEPPELGKLQQAYRDGLEGHSLYHLIDNPDALQNRILQLRDDLATLRRGFNRWAKAVILLLVLIAGVVMLVLLRETHVSQEVEKNTRAVAGAKREVSADARKELANMGIPWNLESFKSATRSGDLRSLELFLSGGFSANQLNEDGTMFVVTQAIYGNVPNFAQVLDLFKKNGLDFHAVETGNENQLFQLRQPNHTLEFEAYDAAAFKRSVAAVQTLYHAGAKPDSVIAEYKGHLLADKDAIVAAQKRSEEMRRQFGPLAGDDNLGALQMNMVGYAAKLDVILTALGIPVDTVIPRNPAPGQTGSSPAPAPTK
jgi:hypothetical protein